MQSQNSTGYISKSTC